MTDDQKFIATEPLGKSGEAGEKLVWDRIKDVFAERKCLAYWRYPIFSQTTRKEPDLLIADFKLGLIVIEVKSITIDRIVRITGHRWEYQNFYTTYGNPYQQAENQLFALLEYSDLCPQVSGRVILTLPYITQEQWQQKGFHKLPSNPPILFKNHLDCPQSICEFIQQTPPVRKGRQLTYKQWQLLLSILAGTPVHRQKSHRVLASPQSRGKVLEKVRSQISQSDLQQEKIGKQIPSGLQRIRGIAGSGKTVLLAQKAAHIHLKYPHWKIAFIFFSRSLYHPIIQQIDKWLHYFSGKSQKYNSNSNLLVLHAWGGKKQPGFYSTLCKRSGVSPLTASDTESKKPNEALGEVCFKLLQITAIPQIFDVILIDEGQDLIVDKWKYRDKQPFYWLAYQSLRTVDPVHPEQKRLIWAYDEIQSLETLKIPTASEIFGEELGHLVTGKYPDGIKKTQIMSRCYRIPHQIITTAHAIGLGLLRSKGILTGISSIEDWQALGYEVEGNFQADRKITIKRPQQNSPNPIGSFWQGKIIEFKTYLSRQQELTALAENLVHNLRYDGLRPCQEILVIILGSWFETKQLETRVATFLNKQGIDIFIPGRRACNLIQTDNNQGNPNKFWCEGAITISPIHRAKGNEADMVYIIGLDNVAKDESNIYLRNQLFVALTRARGWVNLSGIGNYLMYEEMHRVMKSGDTFTFTFRQPKKREISITDVGELLKRYALGGRNFQNADLADADLVGVSLQEANLIGANLTGANLEKAQLDGVKLVLANLNNTNLTGASLKKARLMGANLTDANLSEAILINADLRGANLTRANLAGVDLTGALFEKRELNNERSPLD